MCKFCDNLEYKTITIPPRTTMADDNTCELLMDDDCPKCEGCKDENNYFEITTWEDNLSLSYFHQIGDLIIYPVSTRFSINFCPMCGKRISTEFYYEELKFW